MRVLAHYCSEINENCDVTTAVFPVDSHLSPKASLHDY